MKPSVLPPIFAQKPQGENIQTPYSLRERDDNYLHVIANHNGRWRIIISSAGDQWIIQRRTASTNTGLWGGKGYFTTKKALIAACSRLNLLCEPTIDAALAELPDRIDNPSQKN